MEEVDWFVDILDVCFEVKVSKEEVSYEGTELYLDEIDESFVPSDLLDHLPPTLLLNIDKEGTEWLGAVALHP